MFLPDIVTLSSGAPEESATSSTSLAEKVAQELKFFIDSYILITTLLGITHTILMITHRISKHIYNIIY